MALTTSLSCSIKMRRFWTRSCVGVDTVVGGMRHRRRAGPLCMARATGAGAGAQGDAATSPRHAHVPAHDNTITMRTLRTRSGHNVIVITFFYFSFFDIKSVAAATVNHTVNRTPMQAGSCNRVQEKITSSCCLR